MSDQLRRCGLRSVNHMVWLITTPENDAHSPPSHANTGLRLMVPSLHLGLGRVEKNSLQLGRIRERVEELAVLSKFHFVAGIISNRIIILDPFYFTVKNIKR